ncbi:MAG: 50S ribosomal protein L22 [Bdellovibrionales bacterium]|nr:50S ribosomal protein L22 [Bdellovibrionales bacterium]
MEVKATLKYARIGVLKTLPVVNLIRGKNVHQAMQILSVQKRKASKLIHQLIQSGVANAEQKQTIDVDKLYIKDIYVNRGPHRKSFMPRARGSASAILKKTSHISVVLGER